MEPQLISFEVRSPVTLAWCYAITNWPGWTRLPALEISKGPMVVHLQRNDTVFNHLRKALAQANAVGDPALASSAHALLAEVAGRESS
jgi:hypothetical protein